MSLRVIIAGSRSIDRYGAVVEAIDDAPFTIGEVVSGCADGVDTLGEEWAEAHGIDIAHFPPEDFREEASDRDMPAPLVRNEAMCEYGDALIAVWDGESSGTEYTIDHAQREGLSVHIHRTDISRLDDF